MPIIEPAATDQEQLLQGDVLRGVNLYTTAASWEGDGGRHRKAPQSLCLVLSRPCVATHKGVVVVAGVEKYADGVPRDANSFVRVREFLSDTRDGLRSPDRFYLGQLPNEKGRFCARLDAIHSIQVPPGEQERRAFLRERRIGTLNAEFVRDLHVRVFMAFASLGFSDQSWLSDGDLSWLVQAGELDVNEIKLELSKARTKQANLDAQGKDPPTQEIDRLEQRLAELESQIEPYLTEKSRRQGNHRVND